jgi:phospho-N-acetylmuramoyl-pentapeptide-transferase
MLFLLLTSLADEVSFFNVFRYQTTRTGLAILTALVFVFLFGPRIISLLKVKQGRGQPIRTDGPAAPHRGEAGNAHHGRPHDPVRHLRRHAAVGGPPQPLCLGRAVRDAGLRRHRLLRRLPEGHQVHHQGLLRQGEAACRIRHRGVAVAMFMWIGEKPLATSLAVPFFKDVLIPFGSSSSSSACSWSWARAMPST